MAQTLGQHWLNVSFSTRKYMLSSRYVIQESTPEKEQQIGQQQTRDRGGVDKPSNVTRGHIETCLSWKSNRTRKNLPSARDNTEWMILLKMVISWPEGELFYYHFIFILSLWMMTVMTVINVLNTQDKHKRQCLPADHTCWPWLHRIR